MLKIENLHKIYGKYHALSGLDMTVNSITEKPWWIPFLLKFKKEK